MPVLMRLANKDDAAPVQEIYAPIVRDTATSFETEVPDVIEMRRRISSALEDLPWLVCESEGRILGYAYAGAHRTQAAYHRWGYWSLLLSWAPFVGDPLTIVAGVMREPLWRFTLIVAVAKGGRYLLLSAATLGWMA